MSEQHPMILYVGHPEQGVQLLEVVEPLGWWVYQPTNAAEALGMYIAYLPDVVLMDAATMPDVTEEVYYHLASIQADPVIVMGEDEVWSDRVTHYLTAGASIDDIIAYVAEITGAVVFSH